MLQSRRHDRNASTGSSILPQDHEIQSLLRSLDSISQAEKDGDYLGQEISLLQQLRFKLKEDEDGLRSKDVFRKAQGFQTLLRHLHSINEQQLPLKASLASLSQVLFVLEAALVHHTGNQRYLRVEVAETGWHSIFADLLVLQNTVLSSDADLLDEFYGILVAFCVGNESLVSIYSTAARDHTPSSRGHDLKAAEKLRSYLSAQLKDAVDLAVPDILPWILALWSDHPQNTFRKPRMLNIAIPITLTILLSVSLQNLVCAHVSGLLSAMLPLLFDGQHSLVERSLFREAALLLCRQGVRTLEDAFFLFNKASQSLAAVRFLLEAVRASNQPPRIQFDMTRYGAASLEIQSLRRGFPPMDADGYSLSLWIRIDHFDPNMHTTLFGACDKTQTCFVLLYLEKDTRNLILQTAIKGPRPSVRFRNAKFEQNRWYHICLAHRRPKAISSSKATLYVDGVLAEQVKANYPLAPPADRPTGRVQAFLGTPRDLLADDSQNSSLVWSVASAILLQSVMHEDLVAVIFHLGPRYNGNFQDCLGSFTTYEASAALNLLNEEKHPNDESKSVLNYALKRKGASVLPEDKILLNINPTAVLDDDDRNSVDETQLVRSLSPTAANNLHSFTRGGNSVIINGAIPAINEALVQSSGIAILQGEPLVIVPRPFDDVSWALSGNVAFSLELVQHARTTEEVVVATETVLELVRTSWRNSEAAERQNFYSVLSILFAEKLTTPLARGAEAASMLAIPTSDLDRNALSFKLLQSILSFVGFDMINPSRSIVGNALAYKILLIDSNIWRTGPIESQVLYFEQFSMFAKVSAHAEFNIKRFSRMRVYKRLLEALKCERVLRSAAPAYTRALKDLWPSSASAESFRTTALFITFCLRRGDFDTKTRRSNRTHAQSTGSPGNLRNSRHPVLEEEYLSYSETGLMILKIFADVLCQSEDRSGIEKFGRTVTNRWILYLLSERSADVVILSMRILVRLLSVQGDSYINKFKEKPGGFTILANRLKRWWSIPALWPILFAMLFDRDVAKLDLDRPFDLFSFVDNFNHDGNAKIVHPEIFEVITALLQSGLGACATATSVNGPVSASKDRVPDRMSMSSMNPPETTNGHVLQQHIHTLTVVVQFLSDLQNRSENFRHFAASSSYIQDLLAVLFPVIVNAQSLEASEELNTESDSVLLQSAEIIVQPSSLRPALMKKNSAASSSELAHRPGFRRASSYVLVSRATKTDPTTGVVLAQSAKNGGEAHVHSQDNKIIQDVLEMVVGFYIHQILTQKEFTGLGLFNKTPPSFPEHQVFFQTWILSNTVSQIRNTFAFDKRKLCEAVVLNNIAKFLLHSSDAIFEDWYVDGIDACLALVCEVLQYLYLPDIATIKTVRLCTQAVSIMEDTLYRLILIGLSQTDEEKTIEHLKRITYWQTVVLQASESHRQQLQMLGHRLCLLIDDADSVIRNLALDIYRSIAIQKPHEIMPNSARQLLTPEQNKLITGFQKLTELDNEAFLSWYTEHQSGLRPVLTARFQALWAAYNSEEDRRSEESLRIRRARRQEKLLVRVQDEKVREEVMRRHEATYDHWTSNICSSELLKQYRYQQDQQDDRNYAISRFSQMVRELKRTTQLFQGHQKIQWRVDQTEGRNRMRLRIMEDQSTADDSFYDRRKGSSNTTMPVHSSNKTTAKVIPILETTEPGTGHSSPSQIQRSDTEPFPDIPSELTNPDDKNGDSFEVIDNPDTEGAKFEDKNRKVMRSINRGDQVKHVANTARVVGLEAVEGLLILGKDSIYLMDEYFQRVDQEIVDVWQAPIEERDPYVSMISGRDISQKEESRQSEHEVRSWKWSEIISVSKRRFLFRDVAIEIFFDDGRSYLLIFLNGEMRNNLYHRIDGRLPSPAATDVPESEVSWRLETMKNAEDGPQGLGARFASVFSQSSHLTATKKWQRGEMSNFHYLMLINTLAGRTYNDLTQYPIFPWVIADYTSKELDLDNPRTFRDLSKPMGCQHSDREAEFRDRYKQFAEMGEQKPFHYGTHYSSAMIVTGYLVRLQPYVKSYLLLQGGSFDHADRMFYSIHGAWTSASRTNMTDVRELTPEFYYLPDFLSNINGYDFGTRQRSSQSIANVELPPWAMGDPKIFIAKQRQALESPYVSSTLHKWIDLVFGFKQKGEAAIEAVNVFHHLSYQGATDLDAIKDTRDKLAAIGIIHNFGQTPFQLFQRPHPFRDHARHKHKRLDSAVESLTRVPGLLLDSQERVASLSYSWRNDKLLCSGAFRLNIPPTYDKYMEWGFFDNSIRFYTADSRKQIGLFEHLHVGQLSCAIFRDSKTLITGGSDSVVQVWTLGNVNSKSLEIQPKASLFGHRSAVLVLALSRSLSALLSCSSTGEMMLWDLNRCEFVRRLYLPNNPRISCAAINDISGNIILCFANTIAVFTINGDLLCTTTACPANDTISCVSCYEGVANEWLERDLIFTGHRRGVVRVWNLAIAKDGVFELELVRQLNHVNPSSADGENVTASISCILLQSQAVYTGDEDGRVVEWTCVQRR